MKAVAPRIERLYESEVERWRAAWDDFFRVFWQAFSDAGLEAFIDYEDLSLERRGEIALIIEAWNREVNADDDDDGLAWQSFTDDFDDALPADHKAKVDLSLWPDRVPVPPPDMPEMWEIARRAGVEGGDERLAAGWVLFQLACGRIARLYCREAR